MSVVSCLSGGEEIRMKTEILLSSSGSSSLYAAGPIRSRILNGPMYHGLSFPRFPDNPKVPCELSPKSFCYVACRNSGCEMTVTIRDDRDWYAMSRDYFLMYNLVRVSILSVARMGMKCADFGKTIRQCPGWIHVPVEVLGRAL
ncbi:hypothetical protein Tco_0455526 [Tanacetum coccineum]